MIRDTVCFDDSHSDRFITHGGLFSKKVIREALKSFNDSSTCVIREQPAFRRGGDWDLVTDSHEWRLVYAAGEWIKPFFGLRVAEMRANAAEAQRHFLLLRKLLGEPGFRKDLLEKSRGEKTRAAQVFGQSLQTIVLEARGLGYSPSFIERLLELCFRLSFLFYAEDIGALPRQHRSYRAYDLRKSYRQVSKFEAVAIQRALGAFARQKWCGEKIKRAGNAEFWATELKAFVQQHARDINKLRIDRLWFNDQEIDLAEMSSSDLCDVYQHCVYFDEGELGTVYTNDRLSQFIHHRLKEGLRRPLKAGEVILDPACGSGHLLKRTLMHAGPLRGRLSLDRFCADHLMGIDKNPMAVLVTKLNLWLTCMRPGVPLLLLPKIQVDNTLRRFAHSFIGQTLQVEKFLGNGGRRVMGVISNPPWSMVTADHDEYATLMTPFWKSRKAEICSGKNNLSLNFLHAIDQLLDPRGVATVIMPGVFFVGSDSKIRDSVVERITSYLPVRLNKDFTGVATSQNYGVIGFGKAKNDGHIDVHFPESQKVVAVSLNAFLAPKIRKRSLRSLGSKFASDSLLPLYVSPESIFEFEQLLATTQPVDFWSKGHKTKSLKGSGLIAFDGKFNVPAKGLRLATPENRGGSPRALHPVVLSKAMFEDCHHKVLKFDFPIADRAQSRRILAFLKSDQVNTALNILRTMASIQAATLNLIGLPTYIVQNP